MRVTPFRNRSVLLKLKSHLAKYPHQLTIHYLANVTRNTSHVLLSHQLCNNTVNSIGFQVLKEGMRLLPPVPVHFREAIKQIDPGNGHIIPAQTNIFVSAPNVHRDPRHFPDPEMFDPERFSPQNSVSRHPYAYTPFGRGRRICVGHVFATMEAKTILSTVLRRYRVTELEGGIKGLAETLKLFFVVSPANGMRVKLLPRSHPSHICVT